MSAFRPYRVREEYEQDIQKLRERFGDDEIVDVIERYLHGAYDRDDAMERLGIDYIGTFYEMIRAYDVDKPEPDPVEEARQLKLMQLLLDGKEVPESLRKPASWTRQVN